MSKKKKVKINNILPVGAELSVTRYTFDAWMKCYPESNEEEWAFRTYPENVIEFVAEICNGLYESEFNVDDIKQIDVVTLDEEYFDWLKEMNLENCEQSRTRYAVAKKQEAFRLLQKSEGDRTWVMTGLPIIVPLTEDMLVNRTQSNITITKEMAKDLQNYIQKCIPAADVHVCDFMVLAEEFFESFDKIDNICECAIKEGTAIQLREFDFQTYPEWHSNVNLLYIPVMISEKLKTASFNPTHLLYDENELPRLERVPDCLEFTREELDSYGLFDVPELEESKFAKALYEKYPLTTIEPWLVDVSDIEEEEDDFMLMLSHMSKEMKKPKK